METSQFNHQSLISNHRSPIPGSHSRSLDHWTVEWRHGCLSSTSHAQRTIWRSTTKTWTSPARGYRLLPAPRTSTRTSGSSEADTSSHCDWPASQAPQRPTCSPPSAWSWFARSGGLMMRSPFVSASATSDPSPYGSMPWFRSNVARECSTPTAWMRAAGVCWRTNASRTESRLHSPRACWTRTSRTSHAA